MLVDLADLYPDSTHVRDVGLSTADDDVVWGYAAQHGLTIVSKDADFHERSFILGPPPKVIWIRRGNCSTQEIAAMLRREYAAILAFETDAEGAFLALG
jgi:predicted nuclease of predicted toxin-antitoxin system